MSTITVTSNADSGAGSLRGAIASAQPGDTIRFNSNLAGQTIALNSGQLEIDKELIVDGADAPGLTVSGNSTTRVMRLQGGQNLTLRNLIVADGVTSDRGGGILAEQGSNLVVENSQINNNTAGVGGGILAEFRANATVVNTTFDGNNSISGNDERSGGAIASESEGDLTVRDSEFTNNSGINGGAINVVHTNLIVENSTFQNNTSTANGSTRETFGYGGAIYTDGASPNDGGVTSGQIIIRNSRIESNQGQGQGGGAFLFVYPPDEVIVEDSVILDNQLRESPNGDALGGGIRHGNGDLTIRDTTVANNSSERQGGGLWIGERSPVRLVNTTFSGNRAIEADGVGGLGGAIFDASDTSVTTEIVNNTIANNVAGAFGGAVFAGDGREVRVTNTIFDNNTGNNEFDIQQQTNRPLTDGGNNIQFPAKLTDLGNDTNVTNQITIVDPQLGPLQDNGGGIPTHALQSGSPAIDAGQAISGLETDARDAPRDGQIDIGAFEFGASVPGDDDTLSGFTPNDDFAFLTPEDNLADALAGNDEVIGLAGNDTLFGNLGNDTLAGGEGDDLVVGGAGNDFLVGNQQNDVIAGLEGRDILYGGMDSDTVFGNQGNDFVSGDLGDDTLYGGQQDDNLTGGEGDDFLSGDFGNDTITGGAGADTFAFRDGHGRDAIADFEDGADVIALVEGLTVDRIQVVQVGGDTELRDVNDGEVFASLLGVSSSLITDADFIVI